LSSVRVRCAIYTRKSTDEGLDQSFNSLDAQREACEAYIRSQVGEGWRAPPCSYEDGGFSGGNLQRPAMQQLLADVDAGKVDVIVVYKVDRLTRSLLDFAKIVERLDARGVSFVSVTQAFNTTTSMGRLTLNVLLSFAQFEREVTGERIRDKIAASKAKGMWMGGNLPLGYDLGERRLIVNSAEAEHVRHIYRRYLELGSGVALMKELKRDGISSKRWRARSGEERGGTSLSCGALYYLLQNRLYVGKVTHHGVCYSGDHEAIVSEELFEAVQALLAANRQKRRDRPARSASCHLAGLLRNGIGEQLTTSFSYGRSGRRYRYYVTGSLDPSRPTQPPRRIPAAPLDGLVLRSVSSLVQRELTWSEAREMIASVELYERSIQLILHAAPFADPNEPAEQVIARLHGLARPNRLLAEDDHLRVIIDRQAVFRGGRTDDGAPTAALSDSGLELLRSAHRLLEQHHMSPVNLGSHQDATAPEWQRQRHSMALGLLAPKLQKAIMQGSLALNSAVLERSPLAWSDQLRQAAFDRG
jgi:site-specific DNA recombinase